MGNRTRITCALLAVLLSAAGCSRTKTVTLTTAPAAGTFTVHFDHLVGSGPLMLDGAMFMGQDGAGNAYSVTKLRYFVSNVQLRRSDGMLFGADDWHYRDAGIPGTRSYALAGLPPGTYDRLVFTFGLDARWNVTGNEIQNDPDVAGMEWPVDWGGGWHYMILEGKYDPANAFGYATHMGRRFITATDTAAYPHDFPVRLDFPAEITIAGDAWEASVRMELNAWYGSPDVDLAAWFPNGTGGIMVNLDAQAILQQNGPDCFTLTQPVQH